MHEVRTRTSQIPKFLVRGGVKISRSNPLQTSGRRGLLIHHDLFAQTDFRLSCLCCDLPSCTENPHLQSVVQQLFSRGVAARVAYHRVCEFVEIGDLTAERLVPCGRSVALRAITLPWRLQQVHLYHSWRTLCTIEIAIDPSPTADATRFTLPDRTSPTANTPGRLASSRYGLRVNGQ